MRKLIFSILISGYLFFQPSDHIFLQPRDIDSTYIKPSELSWGAIASWFTNQKGFGKSYALVIGIGDYKKGRKKLEAPFNDALRVMDFLIQDAGFDHITTLTNAKATQNRITELMVDIFPELLKKNDRFFFYFSGHGDQIKRSGTFGYLVLANSGNKWSKMISMREIEHWDDRIKSVQHVLFVLDCCFSGLAGLQSKDPLFDKTIKRLSQYAHHLITAGTEKEQSVGSLSRWNGSLFTDAFLKAASGRADVSLEHGADGVVSLKELMIFIEERIDFESLNLPGIKMSPQMSRLRFNRGEFFFISKEAKNKKVGNDPNNNLSYGLPVTKGGATLKSTALVESLKLRTTPRNSLSSKEAREMLFEKDFYATALNENGRGMKHLYKLNWDTVVVDHATKRTWQRKGSPTEKSYEEAKLYIKQLQLNNYAGFDDWRLPTLEEAMSLMEPRNPFTLAIEPYTNPYFPQIPIWTSDAKDARYAWVVDFGIGRYYELPVDARCFVRAVRSD